MNKITCDGEMDRLFVDDRDARVEQMSPGDRVPSYGANNLHPPMRALSSDEAELANRIGTFAVPASSKNP